jgi:hypothetical protein
LIFEQCVARSIDGDKAGEESSEKIASFSLVYLFT